MAQSRQVLFVVAILVLALCQISEAGRIRHQSNKVARARVDWIKENDSPPVAVADFISNLVLVEDQKTPACVSVLSNDHDVNDDIDASLTEVSSFPTHGQVTLSEDHEDICYIPDADFHGSDSFKYQVCDHNDNCKQGLVRVHVAAVNDAPELTDDYAVVTGDEYSIVVDVLANDRDIDGRYVRRSTFKVVVPPRYGRYFVTSDKKIKYTPIFTEKARFVGIDELTYEICDNERASLCSHAKLTINVEPKCLACEKCADTIPGFDLHVDRVHHFYDQDVLSVKH